MILQAPSKLCETNFLQDGGVMRFLQQINVLVQFVRVRIICILILFIFITLFQIYSALPNFEYLLVLYLLHSSITVPHKSNISSEDFSCFDAFCSQKDSNILGTYYGNEQHSDAVDRIEPASIVWTTDNVLPLH